eukprot:GHVN01070458.1.p1 GENE.GHVN01070458.1~~GHVN01070458.1.p1  ORF type:complete len:195 (+),score=72.49 GHVN01070458.1:1-585(+)
MRNRGRKVLRSGKMSEVSQVGAVREVGEVSQVGGRGERGQSEVSQAGGRGERGQSETSSALGDMRERGRVVSERGGWRGCDREEWDVYTPPHSPRSSRRRSLSRARKSDPVEAGGRIRAVWAADRFLQNHGKRRVDIQRYHAHLKSRFDPDFVSPRSQRTNLTRRSRSSLTLNRPGVSFGRSGCGVRMKPISKQ